MTDATPLPSGGEFESEADPAREEEFVEVEFEIDLRPLSPAERARLDRLDEWAPGYISARIREVMDSGES